MSSEDVKSAQLLLLLFLYLAYGLYRCNVFTNLICPLETTECVCIPIRCPTTVYMCLRVIALERMAKYILSMCYITFKLKRIIYIYIYMLFRAIIKVAIISLLWRWVERRRKKHVFIARQLLEVNFNVQLLKMLSDIWFVIVQIYKSQTLVLIIQKSGSK